MVNVVVFSRMDEELKRALEVQAKRERRSLSNLLVGAAEFYLRQHGSVVSPDLAAATVTVLAELTKTKSNAGSDVQTAVASPAISQKAKRKVRRQKA
jgi:hypothetical protein